MKRIIALVALMFTVMTGSAFAAALTTGQTNTNGSGETIYGCNPGQSGANCTTVIGRLSKGVQFGVAFDNAHYALTTKHLTGSKMYGTAYNSTSMYNMDSTSGAAVDAPSDNDSSAFTGGSWTSM